MLIEAILLVFVIAFIIGVIASILGVGGGALNVPVLVLFFSYDQISAIGASLLINVAISFTAMTNYILQKRILFKTGILIAVPAIIFSTLSVYLSTGFTNQTLTLIFVIILLIFGIIMIKPDLTILPEITTGPKYQDGCNDRYGKKYCRRFHLLHMILWGSAGGTMTGFTGLGGGIVNVPALLSAKIPPHYATATSTMVIFFATTAASIIHLRIGSIPDHQFILVYVTGAVCGAVIGSRYARRLKGSDLSYIFGIFLIFVCMIMTYKTFF